MFVRCHWTPFFWRAFGVVDPIVFSRFPCFFSLRIFLPSFLFFTFPVVGSTASLFHDGIWGVQWCRGLARSTLSFVFRAGHLCISGWVQNRWRSSFENAFLSNFSPKGCVFINGNQVSIRVGNRTLNWLRVRVHSFKFNDELGLLSVRVHQYIIDHIPSYINFGSYKHPLASDGKPKREANRCRLRSRWSSLGFQCDHNFGCSIEPKFGQHMFHPRSIAMG